MLSKEELSRCEQLKALHIKTNNVSDVDFFTSPGRIELLGNHTDHNNGLVLVSSVSLNIMAAVSKRNDNAIHVLSKGFGEFTIDISKCETPSVSEYATSASLIKGIVHKFLLEGYHVGGFDVTMDSTIYSGAGVSSSAAYELLFCQILNYYYNDYKIDPVQLAKISQFSEITFFGKPCGLLDQMGIAVGGVNYIDFKDTAKPVIKHLDRFIDNYDIVIINTGGDHSKLTPFYASIKDEMKLVSNYFQKDVLREVDEQLIYDNMKSIKESLGGRPILRAIHFYDENKRVEKAYESIKNNDSKSFLKMINESGESSYKLLQNCYYDGDKEQYVTLALSYSKKIIKDGATRIHGGGFAGTTITFIAKNETEQYLSRMEKVFGKNNVIKVMFTSNGACHID